MRKLNLLQKLELSTLTPATYLPTEEVKHAEHAAVFVNTSPVILTGYIDDDVSLMMAKKLSQSAMFHTLLKKLGVIGEVSFGNISGSSIDWPSQCNSIAESESGKREDGESDGALVAVVLGSGGLPLTTALCVMTETAQILDENAPELD